MESKNNKSQTLKEEEKQQIEQERRWINSGALPIFVIILVFYTPLVLIYEAFYELTNKNE